MTDVAEIAAGLSKAQRFWLLQAVNGVLSDIATTRMILVGRQGIADYSFRPARLTPIGLAVAAHLKEKCHG